MTDTTEYKPLGRPPTKGPLATLNVKIAASTKDALAAEARRCGTSMTAIIEKLVAEHLPPAE